MRIEGRTALVAGGGSGLGEATARMLHAAGASVVLFDRNPDGGASLAEQLGARSAFHAGDVLLEGDVREAVRVAVERFGRLDVAVNCAGIGWARRIVDRSGPHDLPDFRRIIEVNLIGTFNVARLAAAQMVTQEPVDDERGVIVNTASVAAFDGQIGQVAYAASKGGVVAMTLPVARDLASMQVRCVTIAPGLFDTPMAGSLDDETKRLIGDQMPFPRRLGHPAEFAALVRHVVENPMINGEVIRIDAAVRMPPRFGAGLRLT